MTKNILVIGGAGFIGSHFARRLANQGNNVVVYDLIKPQKNQLRYSDNVEYIEADTRDISKILTNKFDICLHFGEYARVEQSFEDLSQVINSNLIGTSSVVKFALENVEKFIYAGSSTKFIPENLPAHSPYSVTKSCNTQMISKLFELLGRSHAICYFYNVYGPGENGDKKYGTVIQKFINAKLNNEQISITGPGTQLRNFTHIDDTCDALELITHHGLGDGYGIASSEAYSIIQIANILKLDFQLAPEKAGNRMSAEIIDTKTRFLGWEPKRNLEDYLNCFA